MLTCFAHPTCWAGFGEPDTAFWCCYGTGVESFAKLNDNVYFEASAPAPPAPPAPPALWVSQFVPSTLHWRRGGATLHLASELERDGCSGVQLTLTLAPLVPDAADAADAAAAAAPGAGCFGPEGCTIHLRLPSWADPDASHVTLSEAASSGGGGGGGGGDGAAATLEPATGQPLRVGRFLRLHRRWTVGAKVRARFGLYPYVESANDWRSAYGTTAALLYGPHMLVALVGPQAPPTAGEGPPHVLRAAAASVREWVRVTRCAPRDSGDASAAWQQLRLEARGTDGRVLPLAPLSAVVDEPYTSYLDLVGNGTAASR